jgi:hypothetical protein
MLKRISLYLLAGLVGLALALSLGGCGGYGHHNDKGGKTSTSRGY